jgi:hypothetical protein
LDVQVEILRNAIEYIESLEEMLHGQGKLNKNMTPGALAGGAGSGPLASGPATSGASEFLVSRPIESPFVSVCPLATP